jgi:polyphosphate kinase
VPGLSERIRVFSVVDRFLEHTRAFAFGVGNQAEVFISSADWMPRNFHRRVEVMAPVEEASLKQRILDEVLGVGLKDNVKARQLMPDGTYAPVRVGVEAPLIRSQTVLLELARRGPQTPIIEPVLRHIASPIEKIPDPRPTGSL